jgi:ribonuclease VapC
VIVDSSALVAVVFEEPGYQAYIEVLKETSGVQMSAASYVECAVVVDARGDPVLSRRFDDLLAELTIEIVALTKAQAVLARGAYRDFGRGSGHPAKLNLGDTFAYALAVAERDELLFKGDDFGHTDVRSALR